MNKQELKELLVQLDVYPGSYSLDGELLPDRMVLRQNYDKWEVFYFDERGNKEKEKVFDTEEEACIYLLNYLKKQKDIEQKYRLYRRPPPSPK